MEEKISEVGEKVHAQKGRLAELERSVSKMNSSDAFRKSADYEPAEEVVQKSSFWGNAFSGQ